MKSDVQPVAPNKIILTVQDVASELGFSTDWVRDHITGRRMPKLRAVKFGEKRSEYRIRRSDFEAFIESNLTSIEGDV